MFLWEATETVHRPEAPSDTREDSEALVLLTVLSLVILLLHLLPPQGCRLFWLVRGTCFLCHLRAVSFFG